MCAHLGFAQVLVVLFGLIGFVVGYLQQDFRITFVWLAAGSGIAAVICLPDWPWWNRHPIHWLPGEEEEEVRVVTPHATPNTTNTTPNATPITTPITTPNTTPSTTPPAAAHRQHSFHYAHVST